MEFLDRQDELSRLRGLSGQSKGGLAVVWGRRRVGKTRLLLEWVPSAPGLYTVGDQSAAPIQRSYLAESIANRFPDFQEVSYPDWRSLLRRLSTEAKRASWRGPIIFDEFPYLASGDPGFVSLFQNWIDHEAKTAKLIIAIAGSSQRMMQGLVLDASSPLYGRASVLLELKPLSAGYIPEAFHIEAGSQAVPIYAVWGGIPRYWELAAELEGNIDTTVDRCVLDPLSPLHREPERLLLEESPPAVALRPLLDLIGAGAHKLSELAARLGQPATSLSRPLARLCELGLVRRELPFGEPERSSKKSLYRIADPFFLFWFRVVAPHRALLASSTSQTRLALWKKYCTSLYSEAWEDLCRQSVPFLHAPDCPVGGLGPWGPAGRYWRGGGPEWDVVSRSLDGKRLLLGEVKWASQTAGAADIDKTHQALLHKGKPALTDVEKLEIIHALFIPKYKADRRSSRIPFLVDANMVIGSLRR